MIFVMKMSVRNDGTRDATFGKYIYDYDPHIGTDECFTLMLVTDKMEAKKFLSVDEMYSYWMQVCPNIPKRRDGEPYRPLTEWNVDYEPFDIQ